MAAACRRGPPREVQVMYGLAGERRLPEFEVPCWRLRGQPVRCGLATPRTPSFRPTFTARSSTRCTSRTAMDCAPTMTLQVQRVLLDFLENGLG